MLFLGHKSPLMLPLAQLSLGYFTCFFKFIFLFSGASVVLIDIEASSNIFELI